MSFSDPNAMPGRTGPSIAYLSPQSSPNGINCSFNPLLRTAAAGQEFPLFAPQSIRLSGGKFYFECTITSAGNVQVGAVSSDPKQSFKALFDGRQKGVGDDAHSVGFDPDSKKIIVAGKKQDATCGGGAGTVVGVALDMDAKTICFTVNGQPAHPEPIPLPVGVTTVTPAASVYIRAAIKLGFELRDLKFPPPSGDYAPIQCSATAPVSLMWSKDAAAAAASSGGAAAAAAASLVDPFCREACVVDLGNALALLESGADGPDNYADDIKTMIGARARGDYPFEYGVESDGLNKLEGAESKYSKVVVGTLPKLEVARGSTTAEQYLAELQKLEAIRRNVVWFTVVLAALYGGQKSAAAFTAKIKSALAKYDAYLPEVVKKLRYIIALERRDRTICEYGLYSYLSGFDKEVATDKSKLKAAEMEKKATELAAKAAVLDKWRAAFTAEVGDIDFHTAPFVDIDASMAKFRAAWDPDAIAAQAAGAAAGAALDAFKREVSERGKRNIEDAFKEFERFPERAEEKFRKMSTELADMQKKYWTVVGQFGGVASNVPAAEITKLGPAAAIASPDAAAWAATLGANYEKWSYMEQRRLLIRRAEDDLREVRGIADQAWQRADHWDENAAMRLMQEAKEKRDALPDIYMALEIMAEKLPLINDTLYKTHAKVTSILRDRRCEEVARELRSAIGDAFDALSRHDPDRSLRSFQKAKEYRAAADQLPGGDNDRDHEKLKPVLFAFDGDGDNSARKFQQMYKDQVAGKAASDAVGTLSNTLSSARDAQQHYDEERCLSCLAEVEEKLKELLLDPMLGTHETVLKFQDRVFGSFSDEQQGSAAAVNNNNIGELRELRAKAGEQQLNREVTEKLRVLRGSFSTAEDNFKRCDFERALASLSEYKEKAQAIDAEVRCRGRAEVETALSEVQDKVRDFEQQVETTLTQRALEDKLRELRSAFGSAEDKFNHSNFEGALVDLSKADEKANELMTNEAFALFAAERDAAVNKYTEHQKPEFMQKYTDKVISRKASDKAQGISSAVQAAEQALSRHFGPAAVLAELQRARDAINDILDAARSSAAAAASAQDDDEGAASAAAAASSSCSSKSEAQLIRDHPLTQAAINSASVSISRIEQDSIKQQQERELGEAQAKVRSKLSTATDLLGRCNFEGALSAASEAADAITDLVGLPIAAAADVTAYEQQLSDFRQAFSSKQAERLASERSAALKNAISAAAGDLDHCRYELCMQQLAKAKDALEVCEQDSLTAAAVADGRERIRAIEEQYAERVLARQASDVIGSIKSRLSMAKSDFEHHRDESSLSNIADAREKAIELQCNSRLNGIAEVAAFLVAFKKDDDELAAKMELRRVELAVSKAEFNLKMTINAMKQAFDHHQNQNALSEHTKLQELIAEAAANAELQAQLKPAVERAMQASSEFTTAYQERVVKREWEDMHRTADSLLKEIEDKLGRSDFTAATQAYSQALEQADKIGRNELLSGYAPAADFVTSTLVPAVNKLRAQIETAQRSRAISDLQGNTKRKFNEAKHCFEHHQNENALEACQKTREQLDELTSTYGVGDAAVAGFVQSIMGEIAAFEKAYEEKVFATELSRRESKISQLQKDSERALEHSQFEKSMSALAEADEAATIFGSDERFLRNARVNSFVIAHGKWAAAQRAKIEAVLSERRKKEALRNITATANSAADLYSHCRFDESLAAAAKALELISGAAGDVSDAELQPLSAQIAAFRKKFVEERLAAEVAAKLKAVRSGLDNVKFLVSQSRFEDALTALAGVRETNVAALGESKYDGVADVTTFFAGWPQQYNELAQGINERVLGREARDAVGKLNRILSQAAAHAANKSEKAFEQLQEAKDYCGELKADPRLGDFAVVAQAVAAALATIDKTGTELSDALCARQVNEIVRSATASMSQADSLFSKCAYDASLTEMNKAIQILADARDAAAQPQLASNTALQQFAAVKFEAQWLPKFKSTYAETLLQRDAVAAVGKIRGKLALVNTYAERNCKEKALEELAAARELLDENFNGANAECMLASLPVAAEIALEVRRVHETVANKMLHDDAKKIMDAARRKIEPAQEKAMRLLDIKPELDSIKEILEPLLGDDEQKRPVSDLYSVLPLVSVFLMTSVIPLFRSAKASLYDGGAGGGAGGGAASKKRGGADDIVADPAGLAGERIPRKALAVLRAGLPNVPVGPAVHPSLFSGLKTTNQAAVNSKKCWKELEADVVAMAIDGCCYVRKGDNNAKFDYRKKYGLKYDISNGLESLAACLTEFSGGRGLGVLTSDKTVLEKAPDQLASLVAAYEKYVEAFTLVKKHLENADRIVARFRGLHWFMSLITIDCFEEAIETSRARPSSADFGTLFSSPDLHKVSQLNFNHFFGPSVKDGQLSRVPSYDMFLFLERAAEAIIEKAAFYERDEAQRAPGGSEAAPAADDSAAAATERFPGSTSYFKKLLVPFMARCRKEHAQHCFRVIGSSWLERNVNKAIGDPSKHIKSYIAGMSQYPIGLKLAAEIGRIAGIDCLRKNDRWDEALTAADRADKDVEAATLSSSPSTEESVSWYDFRANFSWMVGDEGIVPGSPAAPFRAVKGSQGSDGSAVASAIQKNAGKILFGSDVVQQDGSVEGGGKLANSFNLKAVTEGKGLYARAYWPKPISAYPVALEKDKPEGKAKVAYGPSGCSENGVFCEILVFLHIDGDKKPVEFSKIYPGSAIACTTQRHSATTSGKNNNNREKEADDDFYAKNQTIRFPIIADDLHESKQLCDTWHAGCAGTSAYYFSTLKPGKHNIEFRVAYRLYSNVANTFPDSVSSTTPLAFAVPGISSPISNPIAVGSFELEVPSTPVPRRSILPKPIPQDTLGRTSADLRKLIEGRCMDALRAHGDYGKRANKTEVPIFCTIETDSHVCQEETFITEVNRDKILVTKEPVVYGRSSRVVFRRFPKDGWRRESVAFSRLTFVTAYQRNPLTDINTGPVCGPWVATGSFFEVDARFLSEEDQKLVPK